MSFGSDLWVEWIDPNVPQADRRARQLRHRVPFTDDSADSPRKLVVAYLAQALDHYGLDPKDVTFLKRTIGQPDGQANRRRMLRWRPDRPIDRTGGFVETTVMTLQQTAKGKRRGSHGINGALDVWAAGLRILVHQGTDAAGQPFLFITHSSSSLVAGVNAPVGPNGGEQGLADPDEPAPKDEFVLRPMRRRKKQMGGGKKKDRSGQAEIDPVVRLEHVNVHFRGSTLMRRRFVAEDGVPEEHTLVSNCTDCVFPIGLSGPNGTCRPAPNSTNESLRDYRVDAQLQMNNAYGPLTGPFVTVETQNPLGIPPPAGPTFGFEPRTNDFAAVNAYHHCDTAFRMVSDFGLGSAFAGLLPIKIVHRAPLVPGAPDGRAVNAQVVQVADGGMLKPEIRFGLADSTDMIRNPLGVASDVRWVWHEFCHALLVGATGELEMPFVHSAGDALAAILGHEESGSQSACEPVGVTFPWVGAPLRRHDRDVSTGWGWYGTLYDRSSYPDLGDPFGYVAEQILSSTLFRFYCAIGGDSPDRDVRRRAAHYAVYLITRGIASLGQARTTPCLTASVFASALMEADIGTKAFTYGGQHRVGGALHKVIRWAFQQQGLYHQGTHPINAPGPNEPVDVFLDPGGKESYAYDRTSGLRRRAILIRDASGTAVENLTANTPYQVSVHVGSRGSDAAASGGPAHVQVLHRSAGDLAHWEKGQWTLLDSRNQAVPHGSSTWVGPFSFTPAVAGGQALLARVTMPGDRSTIFVGGSGDVEPLLPCALSAPIDQLVPFDNNLAYGVWQAA